MKEAQKADSPLRLPGTRCPVCADEAVLDWPMSEARVFRNGRRIVFPGWELFTRTGSIIEETRLYELNPKSVVVLFRSVHLGVLVASLTVPMLFCLLALTVLLPKITTLAFILILCGFLCVAVVRWLVRTDVGTEEENLNETIEHLLNFQKAERKHGVTSPAFYDQLARSLLLLKERNLPVDPADLVPMQFALPEREASNGRLAFFVLKLELISPGQPNYLNQVLELWDGCWRGDFPFLWGEWLLRQHWPYLQKKELRLPLRVLLCRGAYQADFQPKQLNLIGQLYPQLGEALASQDIDGLWSLFALWKRSRSRDWRTLGNAQTVFEVAEDSQARRVLVENPDLLLLIESNPAFGGVSSELLYLCEDGLHWNAQRLRRQDPELSLVPASGRKGKAIRFGKVMLPLPQNDEAFFHKLINWRRFGEETLAHYRSFYQKEESLGYHNRIWQEGEAECQSCGCRYLKSVGEPGVALGKK